MRKFLFAFVICAAPSFLFAETYVVPIATAKVKDRVYSTTLGFKNSSTAAVQCEAIYAVPNDPKGGTLRATYEIAPGKTVVEEDTLMEVGALGTMRLNCSGAVVIAARVQTSVDEGRTFDDGRVFPAASEENPIAPATSRSVSTTTDLLVMEIAGEATQFDVRVTNAAGVVVGTKTYELPAFALQIVNLSTILTHFTDVKVELQVASGGGSVVVSKPTRDPALVATAQRMTPEGRDRFNAQRAEQARIESASVEAARTSTAQMLVSSAFKAAPFSEPMTGLVYMRDRWYEPSTGTFLTPDRMGFTDSSNPYIFCGGDPVNCSDPTGEAASVSKSGWIIATDNRNGGRLRRFSPEEIARDPVGVRRFLGVNADVGPSEADALIVQAGQGAAINNARLTQVARGVTAGVEDITRHSASIYVSSLPGVGDAADARQAWTGEDPIAREKLSNTQRVVTAVGAVLPVVTGKALREMLLEGGRTALRQFDIDHYGTFSNAARVGDQLEGHEMLQNLWLEVHRGAKRGSVPLSTMNPAVAVPREMHTAIGREQRALGLFDRTKLAGMSAAENIELNVLAMRRAGVPGHVIQTLRQEALKHAATLP